MFALTSLGGCLASSAAACACSCCTMATREAMKSSARVAWSLLFTISLLLSWLLRDFAKPLISKIPCKSSAVSRPRNLTFRDPLAISPWAIQTVSQSPSFRLLTGIVKQLAGETPPDEWFGQQAVYRLSMGNFVSACTRHLVHLLLYRHFNFSSTEFLILCRLLLADALYSHGSYHVFPSTCQVHKWLEGCLLAPRLMGY